MMRVLSKHVYNTAVFEAETQAGLFIEIGLYAYKEDALIEAINLDYDWESDKPYLATVVASR